MKQKYIVKINRETIRPNPNAGSTIVYIPGRYVKEFNDDGSVSIRADYQTIHTLQPQAKFLYEYIPTLVQCAFCYAEFYHTELATEEYQSYGYSDTVCPKCESFDCCNIEFEKFGEEMALNS